MRDETVTALSVLHVTPVLARNAGGPGVFVVDAARALDAIGVRTKVIATDIAGPMDANQGRAVLPEELVPGVEAIDAQLCRGRPPRRIGFSPGMAAAVLREARRFDVVHVHALYLFTSLASYAAVRAVGTPYVLTAHGALSPVIRARGVLQKRVADALWQRRMIEHANRLHVTSEAEALGAADVAPEVPRVVVPPGIRWAEFQRLRGGREFRQRHLQGFTGPVVLFLGRLSWVKGVDVLIDAYAVARRSVPEARLVIAGPDQESLGTALRRRAEQQGIGRETVFTGLLLGDDYRAALAAADVWALASHSESFGIAAAEAMAAGLPTVVSDRVPLAVDIEAAAAGMVAPVDADAFGAAIARLLGDAALRAELSVTARKFAQRYDWKHVAEQLAAAYRDVAHDG